MKRTTKYFLVALVLTAVYGGVFLTVSYVINSGSNQINTIYVPEVNGSPNFAAPGSESFWKNVQTITVPMIQANSYPGTPAGYTNTVQVQMAWANINGTPNLMIKMKFSNYCPSYISNCGPSYGSSVSIPVVNNTSYPAGKLVPMYANSSCTSLSSSCNGGFYPQDVGFLPLAIGSQYIYPEQAMVMLGITGGAGADTWYAVSYKPKMVLGTTGALDTGGGGNAEAWLWSSNPTDNSTLDKGYPGIYLPNGSPLNTTSFGLPPNASYAIDGIDNASSFYQLGGLPNSSGFPIANNFKNGNLSQVDYTNLMNPFEVQAKGAYNSGSWTVEYVRALSTPSNGGESSQQLQMNPKSPYNYHIAFAVSQGQASQTYLLYYNSVSFWWSFNFVSPSGFNTPQGPQPSSVPLTTLLVAAFLLAFLARKDGFDPRRKFSSRISGRLW